MVVGLSRGHAAGLMISGDELMRDRRVATPARAPGAIPSRRTQAWFWLRSRGLMARQACRNVLDVDLRRWRPDRRMRDAPVLAQIRTPLWTDGRAEEFVLVAGKVHNLRMAAGAFHGAEIPAGACLSFWQQLRRPTARRGFVIGREIRHGCVVPTLAGGICQLSNALATAATQAGMEWVERHGHSARIEATADAAADPAAMADATVFWNYVDLKIRAPFAWRIEVALTADELVLTLRGVRTEATSPRPATHIVTPDVASRPVARSCLTCGETSCSLYQPWRVRGMRRAWLLDTRTPELARYLQQRDDAVDVFTPDLPAAWRRWLPARYRGPAPTAFVADAATKPVMASGWNWLRRKTWLRLWARRPGGRRQSSILDGQRWLAESYARRLSPEHTVLVIDQGLLPHLQRAGVLGGRRYEVLATSLPMDDIQRRLDQAGTYRAGKGADAGTLTDFRADPLLVEAEQQAMRGAHRIVTAHAEVAAYWRSRGVSVHVLPWECPPVVRRARVTNEEPVIVLASSALARKGAHELAEALRSWPCRLIVLGSRPDDATMFSGIDVSYATYEGDWVSRADVVVLPAHVEHSPRAALRALAWGIPVVASPACGLQGVPGVAVVPAGDVPALRGAMQALWLPDHHDAPAAPPLLQAFSRTAP